MNESCQFQNVVFTLLLFIRLFGIHSFDLKRYKENVIRTASSGCFSSLFQIIDFISFHFSWFCVSGDELLLIVLFDSYPMLLMHVNICVFDLFGIFCSVLCKRKPTLTNISKVAFTSISICCRTFASFSLQHTQNHVDCWGTRHKSKWNYFTKRKPWRFAAMWMLIVAHVILYICIDFEDVNLMKT